MRRRARQGSLAINTLVRLVILLLLLLAIYYPWIKKIGKGGNEAWACPGQCFEHCPSDHMAFKSGDAWCQEQKRLQRCCQSLESADGSGGVRHGDIRLYYNNKRETPIGDGETVTLIVNKAGTEAKGSFSLDLGGTAKERHCYAQVSLNNGERYDVSLSSVTKDQLFSNFGTIFNTPSNTITDNDFNIRLRPCEELIGTSQLTITDYWQRLGDTITVTLILVDKSTCGVGGLFTCEATSHTVNIRIPDRRPTIAVALDGAPASTTQRLPVTVGQTHRLDVRITEPLAVCDLKPSFHIATPPLPPSNPPQPTFETSLDTLTERFNTDDCFRHATYDRRLEFALDADGPRALPFDLTVTTMISQSGSTKERKVGATYLFQIEPERRVKVLGPEPGLTREKTIDITCDGVTCTQLRWAPVDHPILCSKRYDGGHEPNFLPIEGLRAASDGRQRFTIATETMNGKYLCIKAETNQGAIYSLGLWNGAPQPIAIDATPPLLEVSYNPWHGILSFTCSDEGTNPLFISDCPERPFSYAFVTDPLLFIRHIITGGLLGPGFSACPLAEDEARWVRAPKSEMPYVSSDVRVICVRAEDAAGNAVVKTKLLYSGQDVLAQLLKEVGG